MTPIASTRAAFKSAPLVPSHLRFTDLSEVTPFSTTHHTGFPFNGTHQPFLPRNFYEAPQYASFRASSALTLDVPATKTSSPVLSIPAVDADNILHSRKTLRTVSTLFNAEGRLTGAKINLSTDEIEAHDYKDYFEQGPKARRKLDAPDITPFWVKSLEATDGQSTAAATKAVSKRGRPSTVQTNSLKPYIAGFGAPGFALASLPCLDRIVTGAVNLDMESNTRPLAKKVVVSLLQRLDVISTQAVREYMHLTLRQYSERHAQKIALCLRVIETAAAPIAKTQWPAPPTYEIESCGRENCSVCALTGSGARTVNTQPHNNAAGVFAMEVDDWSDSD